MRMYVAAATLALFAAQVSAAPKIDVQGLILGDEGARYVKGVPTLDLQQQGGGVQLRFLGWDHSNAVFAIGFFNSGPEPVNVGIENLHASAGGKPLRIYTVDELTRQAKSRATWSKIGLAFLGGLGAAAAANQRSTYHGTITGPYGGMYSYSGSYPSLYGQLQADRISANTATNMSIIQYQLDATISAIGDRVLQTTTVDPGTSFGGLIVVQKLDYGKVPLEFRLDVDWNGERYPFGYLLLRKGHTVPTAYAGRLASNAKPMALVDRMTTSSDPTSTSGQTRPTSVTKSRHPEGAIMLASGAVKIPAKTTSGYCLKTPPGYLGTGSMNFPSITGALPRCVE
jgi:hypothetical protein